MFVYSRTLEKDTEGAFENLVPGLREVFLRLDSRGNAFVKQSDDSNKHYYWGQIIDNARDHLNYFADTSSYRSWVSLNMVWERRARLVFAFHGIGRPFSGSLVCAPFLEFRDVEENEPTHSTVVPVSDEAFVFFYNETMESVLRPLQLVA